MLEVSWEGVTAIVTALGAMGGLFIGGTRLGIMQGRITALHADVQRHGLEISELRNRLEQVAPAAALAAFDRKMETLAARIDEGFMHLNNRIDKLHQ